MVPVVCDSVVVYVDAAVVTVLISCIVVVTAVGVVSVACELEVDEKLEVATALVVTIGVLVCSVVDALVVVVVAVDDVISGVVELDELVVGCVVVLCGVVVAGRVGEETVVDEVWADVDNGAVELVVVSYVV